MAISDKLGLLQKELMRKLLHLAVLVETQLHGRKNAPAMMPRFLSRDDDGPGLPFAMGHHVFQFTHGHGGFKLRNGEGGSIGLQLCH